MDARPRRARILHVAGARPNFPKLAPVMRALDGLDVVQYLVHTGQHFDDALSDAFFRDLQLPKPSINLGVGSGSNAQTTARVMQAIEGPMVEFAPDTVVVYGDVDSTVAAALVAAKLHINVVHVEAGLRSRDRDMPEEINRIMTDHLSSLHLITSEDATENLAAEGISGPNVVFVGNPMIDSLVALLDDCDDQWGVRELGLTQYGVATLHRPSNVDSVEDAAEIVRAMHSVAEQIPMVIPMHPRGRSNLIAAGIGDHPNTIVIDPLSYKRFIGLVKRATLVVTDSGGIQEETTVLGVPCLTLRESTERPVTVTHGTNQLVSRTNLRSSVEQTLQRGVAPVRVPPLWDGAAGPRIAEAIVNFATATSGTADVR